MVTTILWIALAVLTVLLIVIASPIRFSGRAAYRQGGRYGDGYHTEFSASAYYLHPFLLKVEYSSADERARLVVLGFKRTLGGADKKKDDADKTRNDGADAKNIDTANEQDDGHGDQSVNPKNTRDDDTDTENINTTDDQTDGDSDKSARDDDIDTENGSTANDQTKKKQRGGLSSRIKTAIDDIKRNKAYKIIRDKPLRGKLLRWLRRLATCALRLVSFERFKLHARVGMRDPTVLGSLYGCFYAAKSALATRKRSAVDLAMEPVFTEKCLDIDSEAELKTSLSEGLWLLTVAAGTFPYLRVYRAWRGKK